MSSVTAKALRRARLLHERMQGRALAVGRLPSPLAAADGTAANTQQLGRPPAARRPPRTAHHAQSQ